MIQNSNIRIVSSKLGKQYNLGLLKTTNFQVITTRNCSTKSTQQASKCNKKSNAKVKPSENIKSNLVPSKHIKPLSEGVKTPIKPNKTLLYPGLTLNTSKQKARENPLADKVAIITGGAQGIGLACARELMKSGLRGVTIADINARQGETSALALCKEFGEKKAIFVQCDVMKSELVDWAFKSTLKDHKRIDFIINNAGILNDRKWETEITVNLGGCVIGSLLALQYLSRASCGHGGAVINIAGTAALVPLLGCPLYTMTQAGIVALSRSLGDKSGGHYQRTGVRVMALCVGRTGGTGWLVGEDCEQRALNKRFGKVLSREVVGENVEEDDDCQTPEDVGKALVKLLNEGETGSVWVSDKREDSYEAIFPEDVEEMRCCYEDAVLDDKQMANSCQIPAHQVREMGTVSEASKEQKMTISEVKKCTTGEVKNVTSGVKNVTSGVKKVTVGVKKMTVGVKKVTGDVKKVTSQVKKFSGDINKVSCDVKQVTGDGKYLMGENVKKVTAGDVKNVICELKNMSGHDIKKVSVVIKKGDVNKGKCGVKKIPADNREVKNTVNKGNISKNKKIDYVKTTKGENKSENLCNEVQSLGQAKMVDKTATIETTKETKSVSKNDLGKSIELDTKGVKEVKNECKTEKKEICENENQNAIDNLCEAKKVDKTATIATKQTKSDKSISKQDDLGKSIEFDTNSVKEVKSVCNNEEKKVGENYENSINNLCEAKKKTLIDRNKKEIDKKKLKRIKLSPREKEELNECVSKLVKKLAETVKK